MRVDLLQGMILRALRVGAVGVREMIEGDACQMSPHAAFGEIGSHEPIGGS